MKPRTEAQGTAAALLAFSKTIMLSVFQQDHWSEIPGTVATPLALSKIAEVKRIPTKMIGPQQYGPYGSGE